jgi:hypothetical protein
MKYVRALEYVLQNAPVRAKDPETKVCTIQSLIEYEMLFRKDMKRN